MTEPSHHYRLALRDSKIAHRGKVFTGKFMRPHAIFIKEVIDRLECKSILDFGCGKGEQYEWRIPSTGQTIEELWGVKVTKYDPAYEPFAISPRGKYDLVICTQVLGTIPSVDLPWVIDSLYDYATKAIYISERLGMPRKQIGYLHMRPMDWTEDQWMKAIARDRPIEVTLATRETIKGEKITTFKRKPPSSTSWGGVNWPANVTAMNHKWSPK